MDPIKTAVKKKNGELATTQTSCCGPACCEGSPGSGLRTEYGSLAAGIAPGSDLGRGSMRFSPLATSAPRVG